MKVKKGTTRAQKTAALRDWCREQAETLYVYRHREEAMQWRAIGRHEILDEVASLLEAAALETEPSRIHLHIEGLLDHLAQEKARRMITDRKGFSSSHELRQTWGAQGAIAQIDALAPELWELLSPQWRKTEKKHGRYFQVYHAVDFDAMRDVPIGIERWCSQERSQWYQEVAMVLVQKHAMQNRESPDLLEHVFRLTNHLDGAWERNTEILWTLPETPHRSTSVGDIVVALASGAAWIVAPFWYRLITERTSVQKKAIRACELLTHCFSSLYDPNREEAQRSMDRWFEVCCHELGLEAFFERLGVPPRWVGNSRSGRYLLAEEQLAMVGCLDPDDVPDLGNWELSSQGQ